MCVGGEQDTYMYLLKSKAGFVHNWLKFLVVIVLYWPKSRNSPCKLLPGVKHCSISFLRGNKFKRRSELLNPLATCFQDFTFILQTFILYRLNVRGWK